MGKVKNIMKLGAAICAGALGIEIGGLGAGMLYDDVIFITGQAKPDVFCEVGFLGTTKYYAKDAYSSNIARVKYDKKTKKFRAVNNKQPKIKNL